jgi:3-phenylpropionate/cinnamic acid dioxygenase small subunit
VTADMLRTTVGSTSEAAVPNEAGSLVDMATWFEVQRFLTEEARLLDHRLLSEWLTLFTEDLRYWVPARKVRMVTGKPGDGAVDHELSADGEPSILDETLTKLQLRVGRMQTARLLWCENPPARGRHLITNVEAAYTDKADELSVRSNCLVLHARFDEVGTQFHGERRDVLRRVNGSFKIASRKVVLDSTVIWSPAVTTFF